MAQLISQTWGDLWEKASAKYKAQQEDYEKEHEHWWKGPKDGQGSKDGKGRQDIMPQITTATALMNEVEGHRGSFEGMRKPHRGVLDALSAVAVPLGNLMDQASQVAGIVRATFRQREINKADHLLVLSWVPSHIWGCLVLVQCELSSVHA